MRLLLVVLLVGVTSCRDEQAGPKKRQEAQSPPGSSAQAPGAPQATGGQMQVLDAAPASLTHPSGATWASGAVVYLGSNVVPKSPSPGQDVTVTHYFRADKEAPSGWKFFTHVADANSGQLIGNADHEIQNGAAPLGSWPVGKIIPDEMHLKMPNYPGTMRFMIGFWQGEERLAIDNPKASDGQGRMLGPTLGGRELPDLQTYKVKRAVKAPTIDGAVTDAVWGTATEVELVASYDGAPTKRKTRARLLYDDQFLYVAWTAEDPDVWGTKRNKDDDIYNEECVEIFLDADGDGATYNELQVSPHNVQFDASFVARRSDLETAKKWESGMQTAVKVNGTLDNDSDVDQGWTAEMKIPLKNLTNVPHVPPEKGDTWRFNLYRLEHHVHGKEIEGEAYSPLFVGDFHHLPRFARLQFD